MNSYAMLPKERVDGSCIGDIRDRQGKRTIRTFINVPTVLSEH